MVQLGWVLLTLWPGVYTAPDCWVRSDRIFAWQEETSREKRRNMVKREKNTVVEEYISARIPYRCSYLSYYRRCRV